MPTQPAITRPPACGATRCGTRSTGLSRHSTACDGGSVPREGARVPPSPRLKVLFTVGILLCLLATVTPALASPPIDFLRDIRPIFEHRCYECHGEKKQKSGLRLDIKSIALRGGDEDAPDIIPGQAAKSPLIKWVTSLDDEKRMPPKGDRLTAPQIALLTTWIDQGAAWPESADSVKLADKRDHWSFKPVTNPAPPPVRETAWPRNPVDQFILARLEKEGLAPAPEAGRVTWLRRVSFDLIGLPPTPDQVADFLADAHPDAYERVVDALLQSPRYGERWAQHWLDVVRFADTDGFEVNTERPNAWPYRDYVIRAFNQDTPYDHFIREQIAGDSLGQEAATGFLITASALLPGQIGADEPSKRLARQDSLDEIVVNVTQTFLGLSVGCARCHDHKFDPVPQRDYYAMQAFVAGVEYADRDLHSPEAETLRRETRQLKTRLGEIDQQLARLAPLAKSGVLRPAVNARLNTDRFTPVTTRRVRFTIRRTNNLEPCLDELEVFDLAGTNVALATAGTTATSSGDTVVPDRHELRHINDGQYGNSHSWMSNEQGKGWVTLEFPRDQTIDRVVWGRDRESEFTDRLALAYFIEVADCSGQWRLVADSTDRATPDGKKPDSSNSSFSIQGLTPEETKQAKALLQEKSAIEARVRAAQIGQKAFAGNFRAPDDIHLLNRGDPEQPKDPVAPAVPGAIGALTLPRDTPEQARRQALADWIASPQNPLTARVIVNRVWQGHFGNGLVETPSDFGRNGTRPSHPELLDWLASELIHSGWSIKRLHKLLVLSATYRQSSRLNETAARKDAADRLLWRYPARRLESESIRDSMLAVSGRLNLKMFGPGFDLFDKRGGLTGFIPVESYNTDGLRRMIYAHKVRREREAVFGSFDCPDAGQSAARRGESTTPIQALNLFNSRFTLDESAAFAARIRSEAGNDPEKQILRAWRVALARDPEPAEFQDAEPIVEEHGLTTLCRALFNSNEFLFVP